MAKRSLEEKIELTKVLLAKYEDQLAKDAAQSDVQVGDDVTFNYGRKDTKRSLDGKIVAIEGKQVAVLVGIKPYVVPFRDITSNVTAEARKGESTDENPLNAE